MSHDTCKYINPQAAKKTQRLVLLGASGSIGQSTLAFIAAQQKTDPAAIRVLGISVHSSLGFVRQYLRSKPLGLAYVAISDPKCQAEVEELRLSFKHIRFYSGPQGLLEMIAEAHRAGADTVLTAILGAAGIQATLRAIDLGMKIGLANKETLVSAGAVIQAAMERSLQKPLHEQAVLLPVDSEHNSVFRLLNGLKSGAVERIILSASGGPFRDTEPKDLNYVTKEEVLEHPTWSMGAKITVDSAGMINKGLEVIEAHYLFSQPYTALDVWVHRDSLVHAMIALSDGSYLFHASAPDMVFPIAHALFFPEEADLQRHIQASTPLEWKPLAFSEPLPQRYPGFYLCLEAGRAGGTAPAVLNAANEAAVEAFLNDQIRFTQIVDVIKSVLDSANIEGPEEPKLEVFLEADAWARREAGSCIKRYAGVPVI